MHSSLTCGGVWGLAYYEMILQLSVRQLVQSGQSLCKQRNYWFHHRNLPKMFAIILDGTVCSGKKGRICVSKTDVSVLWPERKEEDEKSG